MMNNNYSQIAYYKILEIEKRLKALEEQFKTNQYQSLEIAISCIKLFFLPFLLA